MEGGFLTGSESLCGKSQGESPFFLGKKPRSILPIFSLKESRRVVPNLHAEGALAGTQVRHGQEAPYILFPEMPDKAFWNHQNHSKKYGGGGASHFLNVSNFSAVCINRRRNSVLYREQGFHASGCAS